MTGLPALEAVTGSSGTAPRIEALLPIGVRARQLLVRTLLLGMLLVLADHRPAHLTRVHQALTSLPGDDQRRLGVIAGWKDGPHVVIVEWARERFDEATARWCFDRLPETGVHHDHDHGHQDTDHDHDHHDWLAQRRADWLESGQPWDAFLRSWAQAEGLHAWPDIRDTLDARFDCDQASYGPYFFADLVGTSEADEQAAIDGGLIQANRIQYHGRRH